MNIESIKIKLLVKYPFFGSVVANSTFVEEPSISTAATDGENIYYNPSFIESLTDDQKVFVFAHEICHIAFDHIFRSEGKDNKLWNIATDSVINAFLIQDGLPMIDGGIDIPEAINFDAEEMYHKLLEKLEQQDSQDNKDDQNKQNTQSNQNDQSEQNTQSNQNGQNDQNGQDNQSDQKNQNNQDNQNGQSGQGNQDNKDDQNDQNKNNDVGHDTHSMWEDAIKKKHQKDKSESGSKKQNDEIEKISKLGEKEAFKENKKERKKELERIRQDTVSKSHIPGYTTNSEVRNIKSIGVSKPIVDWRRVLKEATKYDIDWSYKNAGIEDGVITPYLEELPKPETEIVLDTSGSIDDTLLRNFLRECKNILQASKIKVGCFDTKFYGFTEIRNEFDIEKIQFCGGGGTDFDVAVNAFTQRVENKIIFTDGWAQMPRKPLDAIWIVFGGKRINPPGGKVIYIDEDQLNNLYNNIITSESKGRSR